MKIKRLFIAALYSLSLFSSGQVHAASSGVVEKLFVQAGVGAKARPISNKLNEWASVTDFGATPNDETDDTVAIQKAIDAHSKVYMPAGKYIVDPVIGITARTGLHLTGAGKNKTLLIAKQGGGTLAQLAAYSRGSVIRRKFNPHTTVTGAAWPVPVYLSTDGGAHQVRIFNQADVDHSGKTATIIGTNAAGAAQSEVLALPKQSSDPATSGQAFSVKKYKTVTSIVPSASIGADTMSAVLENPYLNEVYLSDFAVVLSHPDASVTATGVQIGIDLRNITRSIVERVHVGNVAPIGGPYDKPYSGNYEVQGYGIVVGNITSGSPAYAGGEVNTIRDSSVWGAYKLVVIDDGTLSPLSSAHATTVVTSDLQAGHHLLVQESQYTTGTAWRDNTVQNTKKQPGDASNSFVLRAEGYNQEVSGGYIEAGNGADYLLYLGTASKNNHFRLSYYSATSASLITDAGQKNEVEYFENSGSIAGGVDPFGRTVKLYDGALRSSWAKFHWDGSQIVMDGGQGATVARNGVGDYTITWTRPHSTSNYSMSSMIDTNVSGHAGSVVVGSHSASNVRIYTYAQNAGVTTIIDPRFVWVRAEQ